MRARRALMFLFLDQGDEARHTEQLMEVSRLSEGTMDAIERVPIVTYSPVCQPAALLDGLDSYVVIEFTVKVTR